MIPQSDLDRIRESFPQILEHYGFSANRDFRVPWRDDSSPSGHYDYDSNLVTDFGRDERFNVFQFVGMIEHLADFTDQAQAAAKIIGLQLGNEVSSTPTRPRQKQLRPRFEIPAKAGFDEEMPLLPFAYSMGAGTLESDVAKAYLHERGFCNHDAYENVWGFVTSKGAFVDDDGGPLFTTYEPNTPRGYLVIPFPVDETFCTVDYVMLRAIPGDKPPQHKELRPRRYKSPLYREYLISSCCETLFVTEGILDCVALEKMICKPCLGLGGVNFAGRFSNVLFATSQEQRPQRIVLALDADEKGRKASARIAADLDALGIPHANMEMPTGCKDPCDVLVKIANGGRNGS